MNFGGTDTTSVVAHAYWRFPLWSVRLCATKLDFALRRRVEFAQLPNLEHLLHESDLCFVCLWISVSSLYVI